MINWENLSQITPPAIIVAMTAFIIHFFGKVITDQKPFADNRRWDAELSGLIFFSNYILIYGLFGTLLAWKFNFVVYFGNWITLFITILLGSTISASTHFLTIQNYKIPEPLLKQTSFFKKISVDDIKRATDTISKPLWIYAVIFSYLLASEYFNKNLFWSFFIAILVFIFYLMLAANFSLRKFKPYNADIYITGRTEVIHNILLLKVNEDNIRYRQEEKIVILNMDRVEKIEIQITKNKVI